MVAHLRLDRQLLGQHHRPRRVPGEDRVGGDRGAGSEAGGHARPRLFGLSFLAVEGSGKSGGGEAPQGGLREPARGDRADLRRDHRGGRARPGAARRGDPARAGRPRVGLPARPGRPRGDQPARPGGPGGLVRGRGPAGRGDRGDAAGDPRRAAAAREAGCRAGGAGRRARGRAPGSRDSDGCRGQPSRDHRSRQPLGLGAGAGAGARPERLLPGRGRHQAAGGRPRAHRVHRGRHPQPGDLADPARARAGGRRALRHRLVPGGRQAGAGASRHQRDRHPAAARRLREGATACRRWSPAARRRSTAARPRRPPSSPRRWRAATR